MPLAPQSTISHWYRTDSFVYHNFAFCYQNPLWSRPIPKGYSLCPFFWQSMIVGLILMRLFVYSVLPFKALVGKIKPEDRGLVAAGVFVIGGLSMILGMLIYGAYLHYQQGVLAAYLIPVLLGLLFLPCLMYASIEEKNPDRCQVEWYVRAACLICLILGQWLMPLSILSVFSDIWGAICEGANWVIGILTTYRGVGFWFLGSVAFLSVTGWIVSQMMARGPVADPKYPMTLEMLARMLSEQADDLAGPPNMSFDTWLRWLNKHNPIDWLERFNAPSANVGFLIQDIYDAWCEEHNAKQKTNAERASKCKAWTDAIARVFGPIALNARAFISYIGALIKARKQGVCPYLMFEDVKKPEDKA